MMHGYLPFDKEGKQLAEFRTWRNTITGEASEKLSEIFRFHIPHRWSAAHLYQAVLNGEEHVKDVDFHYHIGGIYSLADDREKGDGNRRGGRDVSNRFFETYVGCENCFCSLIS